jgi:2-dehydro-3-deoxygluconokinase
VSNSNNHHERPKDGTGSPDGAGQTGGAGRLNGHGKKVLSFGEILLRICPDAGGAWLHDNTLSFYVGGAEANVATALALWGVPSAYFTAMPDNNMMSRQLTAYLQQKHIDTKPIRYQGDRIGLYYLPKGRDLKNAGVIYDRAHSSFSELQPGTIDWDAVLNDVGWLHFTAISPALNNKIAQICAEMLKAASARDITISVDLNYRAKLWQYGAQPSDIMPGLVQYCDVIMGNLWAAEKMLGIQVDASLTEGSKKEDYLRHAQSTSEQIGWLYPRAGAGIIANTFRFDAGSDLGSGHGGNGGINYYTTLLSDKKLFVSKEFFADKIVDKVGSGDCFMAGLIYGLYRQHDLQQVLDFAAAAAFQKLFITSDATDQKVEDILKFIDTYEP